MMIPDAELVRFLQAVLPGLGFRWAGFRKVRRQVKKRLARRLAALGLADLAAYARVLEADPDERGVLDGLLRISISRFHRGIRAFERLRREVLPGLAAAAAEAGEPLRCWSAGCASGEEPYTLSLSWALELGARFPGVALDVLATDADAHMLERARAAEYTDGSLKDLPEAWRGAFERRGAGWFLPGRFRAGVRLAQADVRDAPPPGPFRLILCRYLAFTYFDPEVQAAVLRGFEAALAPGGVLVTAPKEVLPAGHGLLQEGLGSYRKPL